VVPLEPVQNTMTCNTEIMDRYGLENATSWLKGGGPFDATPISFEYTREI
jgi:hypothetical protein